MSPKSKPSEKVQILGRTWTRKYVDSLDEYKESGDGDVHGVTLTEEATMLINNSRPLREQQWAKLHESLHAVLSTSGLSQLLDEKTEEAIVTCLENYLVDKINHRKV